MIVKSFFIFRIHLEKSRFINEIVDYPTRTKHIENNTFLKFLLSVFDR